MVDTKKLSRYGNTKMVAHMGAKGLETENTVAAYVASANRSYYGIETDVHITKDKKVIAIHDENAKRVSGVDILVEESNFDDLRKIRLFDNNGNVREDLCMPSLEDYISVCKRYGKIAVLELKNRMADEDVYMIYDIIESMGYNDSTVYISFSIENLHAIRKKNPTQTVQYLIGKNVPEDLVDTLKEYKYDLDIYVEAITKELLDACHAIGALVNVWTVDKVEKAEELVDMGIDFITTNIIE
jgi:glycerophosphoryl diester phosphodiesterase